MSYSIDLRESVVKFVEAGGSKVEASKVFGITRATVYHWLRKKHATGKLEDLPPKRKGWRKLEPTALLAYVEQHPDLRLADVAKAFNASIPSVCAMFKRLKITRKKRPFFIKSEMLKNERYFWSR